MQNSSVGVARIGLGQCMRIYHYVLYINAYTWVYIYVYTWVFIGLIFMFYVQLVSSSELMVSHRRMTLNFDDTKNALDNLPLERLLLHMRPFKVHLDLIQHTCGGLATVPPRPPFSTYIGRPLNPKRARPTRCSFLDMFYSDDR